MEGRMRKYSQVSPERSKVWTEPPQKHHHQLMHPQQQQQQQQQLQQGKKIPVVYYLCRNRHLEHPHFIEVPLSTSDGLYLRDVIEKLNVLRGKGMAAMYSWSCKRSYKNGFVWHDLSEDDLILPGQGNEYVLKGSELLDESPPDRNNHSSTTSKHQNPKASSQELATSRSQDASSSSSSSIRESKQPAPQLRSPPPPPSNEEDMSLAMSPDLVAPRRSPQPSWGGGGSSPSLTEYKIYQSNGAADASTQTEERPKKEPHPNLVTCTRWVSTEDVPLVPKRSPEINVVDDVVSPPPTSSSGASSSGGKTETLESLIRADANRMNSFRILEEEELLYPGEGSSKMKATDVLLQLITCGSISVKDHHSFGLIPTYKPRFSHVKFPSSIMFSSGPVGLRELDCLSENPRMVGLRMEDKEYFSGSLIEMKKHKDEGEVFVTLKRSSSYNAERNCKPVESTTDRERSSANSPRSKCLPRTIKISSNRQSKNEMMRSPLSDGGARKSSVGNDRTSQSTSLPTSKGGSKRFTEPSSAKETSKDGKVIKIEERLTSGARVIIQSRAPCDDSEDSSGS